MPPDVGVVRGRQTLKRSIAVGWVSLRPRQQAGSSFVRFLADWDMDSTGRKVQASMHAHKLGRERKGVASMEQGEP